MDHETVITLAVVLLALVLFAMERFPVDAVALGIIVLLVGTGVLTPRQGVKGFANPAIITIAAMFVISDALIKTGFIQGVAPHFSRLLRRGYTSSLGGLGGVVGTISAFVNNTPVVATFIPVVSTAARKGGIPPSRLLLPLSYAAILGGTCTLIGTSTNLLVSGIAEEEGLPGFSMFLFAPLGLVFALVGFLYLATAGRRLVPRRQGEEAFRQEGRITNYETEIEITGEGEEGPATLGELAGGEEEGQELEFLHVRRGDRITTRPPPEFALRRGDLLHVRGSRERIKGFLRQGITEISEEIRKRDFPRQKTKLVEIVVLPNSELVERPLKQGRFLEKYRANVLALRSRGERRFSDLDRVRLHPGDILLLQTDDEGAALLREVESQERAPFLSMRKSGIEAVHPRRLFAVGLVLAAIVILGALGLVPIMVAALGGVVFLNLAGVVTMHDVYRAIDWRVIFLIAGALSLGTAMKESGLADRLGELLVHHVGSGWGPTAVVGSLYLITSLLTEMMSNNAAAALLAPVAIAVARAMAVDPTPLLLAVAFAGSASFMTPIGYQTNTMVYSAGNYRFLDFLRVGAPLDLVLWLVATALIPLFYPF